MKAFKVLAVLAVLAIVLTACAVPAAPAAAPAANAAPTAAAAAPAATTAPAPAAGADTTYGMNRKLHFIFVTHDLGAGVFAPVRRGMEDACKQINATCEFIGPQTYDAAQQVALLEAAIAKKPDGISTTRPDPAAYNEVLKKAKDAGITLTIFNTNDPKAAEAVPATFVGQDFTNYGKVWAYEVMKDLPDGGDIAVTDCCFGHYALEERIRSFKETLDKVGQGKWKVRDVINTTGEEACAELAVARGSELYLLNRGESVRPAPAGARILRADIRDRAQTQAALAGITFDTVVDWVAYTPEQVAADIEHFRGRTGQYVFISSATVYEKPLHRLPITESTPLSNPFWTYAANKIACEELLLRAYRAEQFPMTIVRPSHTYDRTKLPLLGYYTAIARLRAGKPAVVHGDGTSLWVLTHHRDFAVGFVGLLGNLRTVGEAFHITSDELLTWNQIYTLLAAAAGAEPNLVHVPSEIIARFDPELGAGLLGDKAHSVMFDNSKIRSFVPDFAPAIPFAVGAQEIMAWYDADPARQVVNPVLDRLMDALVAHMQAIRI